MKSLAAYIFSSLLLVSPAAAQHGGGSHSGGGGHYSGSGHTGGGGSGFHGGGGGSVGGRGGYVGGGYGGYSRGRSALIVPYAYPAFGYGYYGGPGYGSGYVDPGYNDSAPPPETLDYAQPAPPPDMDQQVPQPDNSRLQIYQSPAPTPEEQAMSEGRYYLIAYKDHSIYTALAYWMENGALHYVTPQNAHNQVSLELLDLDFTKQLNARRGLAFNIVNR